MIYKNLLTPVLILLTSLSVLAQNKSLGIGIVGLTYSHVQVLY